MSQRARIITILTILMTAQSAAVVVAQDIVVDQVVEVRARVAIMPVVAREGGSAAVDTVTAMLAAALDARGYAHFVDADLRPILRRHRIRSSKGVDRQASILLARESTATHLLLVTIESWVPGSLPEVALTARVLRPGEAIIAEAVGVAMTSDDHPGSFNIDRANSLEILAAIAVDDLIADLVFPSPGSALIWTSPTVAVVPLDAPGGSTADADAATTWLLTTMVEEGMKVLEPGEISSLLYANQRSPRGSIDLEAARVLYDELGVNFVLTGSIDEWSPLAGDPTLAVPHLVWGLRLLDASTLRLVETYENEHGGHDDEGYLGQGRIRALGELARSASKTIAASIQLTIEPVPIEVHE